MSLHKLAEVTITVYGLPEHCGTDEALQELTEEAKSFLQQLVSYPTFSKLIKEFPGLANKTGIKVRGLD